ncbi:MAG: hypothetical protein Q8P02_01990 [Candidatus Micrarchaeota archaeon]|nr:hypothetical protein [Candidatus Micrarchaeota archaeon]
MAEAFPGALGVLHLNTFHFDGRPNEAVWTVASIQGCFKKGKAYGVGHSLYKQYRDWKERLLDHAFALAVQNSVGKIRLKLLMQERPDGRLKVLGAGNEDAFHNAALRAGFDMKIEDGYVTAVKRYS